jgi:hypothetical protein
MLRMVALVVIFPGAAVPQVTGAVTLAVEVAVAVVLILAAAAYLVPEVNQA